jgi:transposase-like protein
MVEQCYQAVRDVLNDGASVTDVARHIGDSRQRVHEWLVKYANRGLPGLMHRSTKPLFTHDENDLASVLSAPRTP